MIFFRSATALSPRQTSIALTILRVVTGIIFTVHGAQKLFVFGFDGVSGAFAGLGIPFAGVVGPFIALVEFLGGLALMVGLLTRLAALGLASTMVGAILIVHLKNGFFSPNGFEFPLSLLAASLVLAIVGAGSYSADEVIANRLAPAAR
jgi:putative oxidoreductase